MQREIHLTQQAAQIVFLRNRLLRPGQMIGNTKFPAVVHLLPQLPAKADRRLEGLIHHNPGDALPLSLPQYLNFPVIQQKSPDFQPFPDKADYIPRGKVPGESQIVTVPGVGNAPPGTPTADFLVKIQENPVADGGRSGSPLRKPVLIAAQHGKQNPVLLRVDFRGKDLFLHTAVGHGVEKVIDVQLQHHRLSNVGPGVFHNRAAGAVGRGVRGHRQGGKQHLGNPPLDGFQQIVRHGQGAQGAVTFGQLHLPVMPVQPVADGVQGAGGKSQIPLQGGKLPVYNHLAFLPSAWMGTIPFGMAKTQRYLGAHGTCAGIPRGLRLNAENEAKIRRPAATRRRCQNGQGYCSCQNCSTVLSSIQERKKSAAENRLRKTVGKPRRGFPTSFAVCCAHNLSPAGGQISHLQPVKYVPPGTRPGGT